MQFSELGLIPEIQRAVSEAGYTEPTPIQQQAIPFVLAGRDVMGAAQTGTGKTAGFTLPLLQRLAPHANSLPSPARHPVRALLLTPTRELAVQVFESVQTYGKYLPLRAVCIYGGVPMGPQTQELLQGREIVVATPGRLLDHVESRNISFAQVSLLVLDEADRMLDMGFIPDIRRILALLPQVRQSLLFSATFSDEIRKLAASMLRDPVRVEVARNNSAAETVTHRVLVVSEHDKRAALTALLLADPRQALVFVNTKFGASRLAVHLARQGIQADAIHGDKSQQQRTEALEAFKRGEVRVLVATDVAARGLDIEDLPFVVNFELPGNAEDYVHRIGRTGRAGKSGEAMSLMDAGEEKRLLEIEKLLGRAIPREVVDVTGSGGRGERRERGTERAPAAGRAASARRRSPVAVPAHIAADGFDFSKPYEPSTASANTDAGTPPERTVRRSDRQVAALLGGLPKNPS